MLVVVDDCVFFFKQKTAYEMRISDWSSDVCSSDLGTATTNWPTRWPATRHWRRRGRARVGSRFVGAPQLGERRVMGQVELQRRHRDIAVVDRFEVAVVGQ